MNKNKFPCPLTNEELNCLLDQMIDTTLSGFKTIKKSYCKNYPKPPKCIDSLPDKEQITLWKRELAKSIKLLHDVSSSIHEMLRKMSKIMSETTKVFLPNSQMDMNSKYSNNSNNLSEDLDSNTKTMNMNINNSGNDASLLNKQQSKSEKLSVKSNNIPCASDTRNGIKKSVSKSIFSIGTVSMSNKSYISTSLDGSVRLIRRPLNIYTKKFDIKMNGKPCGTDIRKGITGSASKSDFSTETKSLSNKSCKSAKSTGSAYRPKIKTEKLNEISNDDGLSSVLSKSELKTDFCKNNSRESMNYKSCNSVNSERSVRLTYREQRSSIHTNDKQFAAATKKVLTKSALKIEKSVIPLPIRLKEKPIHKLSCEKLVHTQDLTNKCINYSNMSLERKLQSVKSTNKLPIKTPDKSCSRSPTRSPIRMPSKSPIRMPSKSPIRTPSKSSLRSTSRSPTRSPARSTNITPTRSPNKSPIRSTEKLGSCESKQVSRETVRHKGEKLELSVVFIKSPENSNLRFSECASSNLSKQTSQIPKPKLGLTSHSPCERRLRTRKMSEKLIHVCRCCRKPN